MDGMKSGLCWMKWRFSGQWNVRLLRFVSDSVLQPLHSVLTTNKMYIERWGALNFALSTVLAVRRRALLRNLLTAVCRIFIEFPASFCYIMLLYRTIVTCSATENKTPGLQYLYSPRKSITRTFLAKAKVGRFGCLARDNGCLFNDAAIYWDYMASVVDEWNISVKYWRSDADGGHGKFKKS